MSERGAPKGTTKSFDPALKVHDPHKKAQKKGYRCIPTFNLKFNTMKNTMQNYGFALPIAKKWMRKFVPRTVFVVLTGFLTT